jgi:MOSC domain-containing protein YiiM
MSKGTVVAIYVRPARSAPTQAVNEARAVPGRGLEGDRHFADSGMDPNRANASREVTLIEAEAMEALARDYSLEIGLGESRRNIVTRDVALNHLVGREFRVGEVILRGIRLCEPCSHLQDLTQHDVLPGLVHRGGLRAQILTQGMIRPGDRVETVEAQSS